MGNKETNFFKSDWGITLIVMAICIPLICFMCSSILILGANAQRQLNVQYEDCINRTKDKELCYSTYLKRYDSPSRSRTYWKVGNTHYFM